MELVEQPKDDLFPCSCDRQKETVKISFGSKYLDGIISIPAEANEVHTAVVLTHGAGGDMNFKHLVSLAESITSVGILSLRFTCKGLNLVYRVKAYGAVVDYLKKTFTLKSIFLGGRSMGARAAAALARQLTGPTEGTEEALRGLVCLSFPLHPPGKKAAHQQRSEDLRALTRLPVLFVSGTADGMCEQKLLEDVTKLMKTQVSIQWIEGASHGLVVKGRPEEAILAEVNASVTAWMLDHVTQAALL